MNADKNKKNMLLIVTKKEDRVFRRLQYFFTNKSLPQKGVLLIL